MDNSHLLKLAFGFAIVGLISLVLVSWFTEPQLIGLGELEDNLGKTVVLRGEISDITYKTNVVFIDLKDASGEATVVLFDLPTSKLRAGDRIEVRGKSEYYKGKLEVVAEEIIQL